MDVLYVNGIGCASCVRKITGAIQAKDPDARLEVERAAGKVLVDSDLGARALCEMVRALGFESRAA